MYLRTFWSGVDVKKICISWKQILTLSFLEKIDLLLQELSIVYENKNFNFWNK